MKRHDLLPVVVILLLAAFLRWHAIGVTEFKLDEATISQLALDLARGRDFPLLGIGTSAGIPNTPIGVYVYAVPYLLGSNPAVPTLFVGMLNVLAVALTYTLTRRFFGERAAVVAALLYAVSPWAVIYSRKLWANNLMPPFVVATVLTALLGYKEGKGWAQIAHWPLLALTAQIHYSGLFLVPASLLTALLWRDRIHWRRSSFGMALAALTVVPFLIGIASAGPVLPPAVSTVSASEAAVITQNTPLDAMRYAVLLTAGTQIHALAGAEAFSAYLARVPTFYPLFLLVPFASLVGLTRVLFQRSGPGWIVALWLFTPVAGLFVLALTGTPIFPHYLIPMLPAPFILAGAAVPDRLPPVEKIAAPVVGVAQVWMLLALIAFLDREATPGAFGTPLHYLLEARQAVLEQSPPEVIVVSSEERLLQEAAVWDVLLDGKAVVRAVDGTDTLLIPAGDHLVLVDQGIDLDEAVALPRREGMPPYQVGVGMQPPPHDDLSAVLGGGVRVTGINLDQAAVLLELSGPPPADVFASVQAYDALGERIAQSDRLTWPGYLWRPGDTLVVWFDMGIPPETHEVTVALYTQSAEGIQYLDVLDEAGNPAAPWITLTLNGGP